MDIEFLGRGWAFPFAVKKQTGGVALSRYEEKVKESIQIILGTAKGERVMRPDFGCGIHEFVFSVLNSANVTLIKSTVREALMQWEPRITVKEVVVVPDQLDDGILQIQVTYQVVATNNEFNLVYPFYLKAGA